MKGRVDEQLRALLKIKLGSRSRTAKLMLEVWIDTAFNGGLVLPRGVIERLALREHSVTSAVLADGQQIELPTYTAYLDWFGREYRTQVIANEGTLGLLGTSLLIDHELLINYRARTLTLD